MGCVVELLHTATLIHDDVVDQAPLRRGRPSANARWGDDASILVGDHLYSKSFALMVGDGDPRVLDTLARATVSMTEAEVFQLERKRSGTTSEADYLRIITQKTASFMSACCRIGGMLGGAEPEQVDGLTRYGLDIGIAFQISDDSLDFVADQARLGKAVGADLKEGKRTLPLIATLDRAEPAERERIQSLLKSHALDPAEIEEIRRLVVKYEGIEYALARAHAYAQTAKEALAPFPTRRTGTRSCSSPISSSIAIAERARRPRGESGDRPARTPSASTLGVLWGRASEPSLTDTDGIAVGTLGTDRPVAVFGSHRSQDVLAGALAPPAADSGRAAVLLGPGGLRGRARLRRALRGFPRGARVPGGGRAGRGAPVARAGLRFRGR
mgnify:CR=1 FL=1